MQAHIGLEHRPVFAPAVGRYAQGMIVEVPLQLWALPGRAVAGAIHAALASAYAGERFVEVATREEAAGVEHARSRGPERHQPACASSCSATADRRQARLVALLDNLGKGASGAAVQNLNIMLGLPEEAGLG